MEQQGFQLLPAKPGTCPECAVEHDPRQAHDKTSLFYQYHYRAEHGRWPTWRDAIAHCSPRMRKDWESELRKLKAWDGWTGDVPPVPDVLPTPEKTIGTVKHGNP